MLTAIFEYGFILAMKKYQNEKKKTTTIKKIMRVAEGNPNKSMYPMALKETDERENAFNVDKMGKVMDKWTMIGSFMFMVCFYTIYGVTHG